MLKIFGHRYFFVAFFNKLKKRMWELLPSFAKNGYNCGNKRITTKNG